MERPATVVVLYGPRAAGKSWVAAELGRSASVHHVDLDLLVLERLGRGLRPDPHLGWLGEVEVEVRRAVALHARVSVEATGAWESDWMLADRLAAAGCRVLPVWVTAPVEETLQRLADRRGRTVPVTVEEARWIHAEATRRAAGRSFTAIVDTSGAPDPGRLRPLATLLR